MRVGRAIDAVDRTQRRFTVLGYPIAVIYKYFDDQGNYLAAIITYYAFIAIFPLLLLASSILGFLLQGDPHLRTEVIDSSLGQFPIIGSQLNLPEGLKGSTWAIVVGAVVAIYGCLGLGQSVQNALNISWSVPRNSRPNPVKLRVKSLGLLLTAGLAVLIVSALSIVGSSTHVLGGDLDSRYRWLIQLASVGINGAVLTILFRLGTARTHAWRYAAPGGFVVALLWLVLQYLGTVYVTEVLAKTSAVNQTFGLVLGMLGIIFVAASMGVLGMEVNVVLARRLWPRALLTPFTDNVELTDADRRAYISYARAQRHKGFETVDVTFTDTMKLRLIQDAPDDDADHAS